MAATVIAQSARAVYGVINNPAASHLEAGHVFFGSCPSTQLVYVVSLVRVWVARWGLNVGGSKPRLEGPSPEAFGRSIGSGLLLIETSLARPGKARLGLAWPA